MYRKYNVKISKEFFNDEYQEYLKIGNTQKEDNVEISQKILEKYLCEDIIDGKGLEEEYFRQTKCDIFISYSHNDVDLVKAFAGWISKNFGLKVFFDEALWGSSDYSLHKIDDKYCLNMDQKTYSYTKRNLSTSQVHSMLTVAIMKMIDISECVFFINTEKSIPITKNVMEGEKNYTMSPWIYQELTITNNIRLKKKDREEFKCFENVQPSLKVQYEVDLSELKELNQNDINKWKERFDALKYFGGENALDVLYKITS